jgi:pyrrolidone-carboxylate peptidase
LEREGWEPDAARLRLLVVPCRWWGASELIADASAGVDAIVLFGARKARRRALVARFACNQAKANAADGAGYCWPGSALSPGAADTLHPPFCAHRLARAMEVAGLPAKPAPGCDRYVYNHCYYRLLSESDTAPAMLVRLPVSIESARHDGGDAGHVNRMQIVAGVAAALSFAAAAAEAARVPPVGPSAGMVKLAS